LTEKHTQISDKNSLRELKPNPGNHHKDSAVALDKNNTLGQKFKVQKYGLRDVF
jgi:hypothetical protein